MRIRKACPNFTMSRISKLDSPRNPNNRRPAAMAFDLRLQMLLALSPFLVARKKTTLNSDMHAKRHRENEKDRAAGPSVKQAEVLVPNILWAIGPLPFPQSAA